MQEFLQQNFLFIVTIVIVLYAIIALNIRVRTNKEKIEHEFKIEIEKSKEQIENSISPRVVFCSSIEQVRNEAANIISEAADNFSKATEENAKRRAKNKDKLIDISQYFVTIYGAASLFNESEAGSILSEDVREDSINSYLKALDSAARSKLQRRRYVSLITDSELKDRSESVKKEYIDWLKEQKALIKKDPNYIVIVSPRAPQWGSSNTSIITKSGLIEIKGHGRSAFAIDDERIAIGLRSSLRKSIYDAQPQNRREIHRNDEDSMEWLEKLISSCDEMLNQEA